MRVRFKLGIVSVILWAVMAVSATVMLFGVTQNVSAAETGTVYGDVDCDGYAGRITDVILLSKHVSKKLTLPVNSQYYTNANCNLNGKEADELNVNDLKLIIDYLLGSVKVLPYPEDAGEKSSVTTSETTTSATTTSVPENEFAPYVYGMDATEFTDWGGQLKIFLNIGGFEGHYTLDTVSTDLVKVIQDGVTLEVVEIGFKSLTVLEIQPLTNLDEGTLDIYYDGKYMGKISYPDGGAITGTTPPDITTTTGSSPGDSGTTTSVTVPDDGSLAEINVNETESADWINFYKSALNSMGNTSRLVEKMSLAKAGEPIKVGFIGGSFTVGDTIAGDSYAVQVYKYFENTFGTGSNISYVNAGLSGTNSTTALMRSDLDLFSQSPDVIFIEFAVNDDGSNPDCKAAFDALVAKAISQPNNPAVIIQINRPGYPVGGTQEYMVQSAAKYDVPVISINDAINIGCPSNDYISGDNIHPTANGHTIIAKTVQYFFREVIRTRSEYAVVSPKNVAIPGLAGATLKTSADLTNFSSTMDRVFDYFYNSHFPENFGGNGNISFTTQGKGVIVAYKGSDAGQTFTVTVNGKTVTGKSSNNWGGAESIIAFNSETTQELNVTITSGNITILGISISG